MFQLIVAGLTAFYLLWMGIVMTPSNDWQSKFVFKFIPLLFGAAQVAVFFMELR